MDIYDYEKHMKYSLYLPIDMNGNRITGLQNPRTDREDAISYSYFTTNYMKLNERGDLDCNGKRFFNIGSYTNNNVWCSCK